jgi:hypothetical protein
MTAESTYIILPLPLPISISDTFKVLYYPRLHGKLYPSS